MPATQISSAAFAASLLASAQSEATESTPPAESVAVSSSDVGVVAHASVGGGECPVFSLAYLRELSDSAVATTDTHGGAYSLGAFVLLGISHASGSYTGSLSNSARIQAYDRLLCHAERCIGAGC